MKVLYYPHITRSDYDKLISKFSDEYKTYTSRTRFSYVSAIGVTLLSWALSYRYRFKFGTFAALSVGSFALTKCALSSLYNKRMKNNCDGYAKEVANAYPEIKYLQINFTRADNLKI
jgi:hypothetical protein